MDSILVMKKLNTLIRIVLIYLVNVISKDKKWRYATIRLNYNTKDKWRVLNYQKIQYSHFMERRILMVKSIELRKLNHAWMHSILANEDKYISWY